MIQQIKEKNLKLKKEPKWVTVFQSKEDYLISIYKLKLESEEIPVMVFDQRDSSYNAFGDIYLQVLLEDESLAKIIIERSDE
jgi:hypothetical protein